MNAPEPTTADAVLQYIRPGTDLVVPIANGEPVSVLDVIEAAAESLQNVRVHQMHALHDPGMVCAWCSVGGDCAGLARCGGTPDCRVRS